MAAAEAAGRAVSALAWASRTLAQGPQPAKYKAGSRDARAGLCPRPRPRKARGPILKNPDQMPANLAEGWRDREAGTALELRSPEPAPNQPPSKPLRLAPSQRVRHIKFGDGVVTRIDGAGDEAQVYILFDGVGDERRFQANLIYDKLAVIAS